jgi:hypothetical protein
MRGFQGGVGVAKHGGVEAEPAHDHEAVGAAIKGADVELAAVAVQRDIDRVVPGRLVGRG